MALVVEVHALEAACTGDAPLYLLPKHSVPGLQHQPPLSLLQQDLVVGLNGMLAGRGSGAGGRCPPEVCKSLSVRVQTLGARQEATSDDVGHAGVCSNPATAADWLLGTGIPRMIAAATAAA